MKIMELPVNMELVCIQSDREHFTVGRVYQTDEQGFITCNDGMSGDCWLEYQLAPNYKHNTYESIKDPYFASQVKFARLIK